jgi:hypothetical protein
VHLRALTYIYMNLRKPREITCTSVNLVELAVKIQILSVHWRAPDLHSRLSEKETVTHRYETDAGLLKIPNVLVSSSYTFNTLVSSSYTFKEHSVDFREYSVTFREHTVNFGELSVTFREHTHYNLLRQPRPGPPPSSLLLARHSWSLCEALPLR